MQVICLLFETILLFLLLQTLLHSEYDHRMETTNKHTHTLLMAMALRWHVPTPSFRCGFNGCRIVLFFIANRGAHVHAFDWTPVRFFCAYEHNIESNFAFGRCRTNSCINAYVHRNNGMACLANLLLWLLPLLKVAANDLLAIEIVMLMIYGKYWTVALASILRFLYGDKSVSWPKGSPHIDSSRCRASQQDYIVFGRIGIWITI